MPDDVVLNVPMDSDTLYLAERYSRDHGMRLIDRLRNMIAGYAESQKDEDDLAVSNDAMARDDGARYTSADIRKDLGL